VVTVAAVQNAAEGGTNGIIRFTRTGDTSSALTVTFLIEGTASYRADYTIPSGMSHGNGSVQFAAGAATADVVVTAGDDIVYDPAETVNLSLLVPMGGGYTAGTPSSAEITITDNELAPTRWQGVVPSDWSHTSNWTNGVPTAGSAVYFDGNHSNADATIPAGAQFAELHFVNNYSGRVTLAGTLTVGKLEMASAGAKLDQPAAGRDITVTSQFVWTGGTLNSTTNLSTVTVTGSTATALIAPTSGGTVSLGSNISLSDGAVATLREGTITATNSGLTFTINANSGMAADPGQNKETLVAASPGLELGPKIEIKAGGWVEVRSGSYSNKGTARNDGGRFTLLTGTRAVFTDPNLPAYNQVGGTTELHRGSTLRVEMPNLVPGVSLRGGSLVTVGAGSGADAANIEVTGESRSVHFRGADVYINSRPGDHGSVHEMGTLRVDADVYWTAGTYYPRVPGEHNGWTSDLWHATDSFILGRENDQNRPTLAPIVLSDESTVPFPPTAGDRWLVMSSDVLVRDAGFHLIYPETAWIIDQVDNPVRRWFIRAK
jgi:hypothetical protein